MKVEDFVALTGCEFFSGVPDSLLAPLGNYLMDLYGIDPKHHVIAANEGNCTALAAGYHLATGKVPAVYMQNSGEGNIINPAASLLNEKVYGIPVIFIVGWRGEPGLHDEPQHIYQGEITTRLLQDMGIDFFIIDKDTSETEVSEKMTDFRKELALGKDVAFVVRKGAFVYQAKGKYSNSYLMRREEAIRLITRYSAEDPIVSTTGKASRELFEIREADSKGHKYDFLTVGSMGHSSSIALGIASQKRDMKVWCIDGDGALLMHMGSLAVIGALKPNNLVHIVINNEAHESVGGMPTVAGRINLVAIAKACGYPSAVAVENPDSLERELRKAKEGDSLCFIEVKCAIGARQDLGRPTTTAGENKTSFMDYLSTF
ncbi:MAG: phosphonopyruvate decarboxylase [Lachnospiraceae bacterium]|nr:phosphonopyruvate decarboxylase [Lachnospiraceae bacterium]